MRKFLLLILLGCCSLFVANSTPLSTIKAVTSVTADKSVGKGPLFSHLNSITLNGKSLVYNASSQQTFYNSLLQANYFFSIPLEKMNSDVTMTINYVPTKSYYKLYINGILVDNDAEYTFKDIAPGKTYEISVKRDGVLRTSGIIEFTGLPIVQLYGSTLPGRNKVYVDGNVKVHDPNKVLEADFLNMRFRLRGGTTLNLPKKSFNIKLKDEDGLKLNKSFLGLRDDNAWVLDGLVRDPLRMRNTIAFDLWNDYSKKPFHATKKPDMINGRRGKYVEVFINDEYKGLYCLCEKIDRKQLKLKSYDPIEDKVHGVLYKSDNWSWATFMGHYMGKEMDYMESNLKPFNNKSETWDGFEGKYPDLSDGESFDWEPLRNGIGFIGLSSFNIFEDKVAEKVDLNVWLDYYLLIELSLATDNHGKNMYVYYYDKEDPNHLGCCPWDMDGTFGIRWDSDKIGPSQDFTYFIVNNEHGEHSLYTRLKQRTNLGFQDSLQKRYKELSSTYFDPIKLLKRFQDYYYQFKKSGAAPREELVWGNHWGMPRLNFEDEMDYITTWLFKRTFFLENVYGSSKALPKATLTVKDNVKYGDEPFNFSIASTNNETEITYDVTKPTVLEEISKFKLNPKKYGTCHLKIFQLPTDNFRMLDTAILIRVNKRELYVITDNKKKEVGTENPEFTFYYEGLLANDDLETVVTNAPVLSCEATVDSPEGRYDILLSGGKVPVLGNYKLILQNGILTVGDPSSLNKAKVSFGYYPNPVVDQLVISNLKPESIISITNLSGMKLFTSKAFGETMTIDMSGMLKGTYCLQVGKERCLILKK